MERARVIRLTVLAAAIGIGIGVPYVLGAYMVSVLTLGLIYALYAMSIDLMGGYGGLITLGLIYALYAMSIDLMGGYGGLITLGQGGILAAGSYGVGYVASRAAGGTGQQLLYGLLATLILSAVFGVMAMRTSQVYFLMVTLAQGMIVWGFVTRSTTLGAENGLRGIARPAAFAAYWKYYYLCLAIVVASGLLMGVITRSPFGLSLRALKDSETRLRMLGYNLALTKFYVFVVSGFFAGVAGMLLAYYTKFVSPANAAFATSGRGVLMVILGGVGTLFGPVIGAFLIVLAENILSAYFARWTTVLGLVFVLTIMFAPGGLVGGGRRVWGRIRRSGGAPGPEHEDPSEQTRSAAPSAAETSAGLSGGPPNKQT